MCCKFKIMMQTLRFEVVCMVPTFWERFSYTICMHKNNTLVFTPQKGSEFSGTNSTIWIGKYVISIHQAHFHVADCNPILNLDTNQCYVYGNTLLGRHSTNVWSFYLLLRPNRVSAGCECAWRILNIQFSYSDFSINFSGPLLEVYTLLHHTLIDICLFI